MQKLIIRTDSNRLSVAIILTEAFDISILDARDLVNNTPIILYDRDLKYMHICKFKTKLLEAGCNIVTLYVNHIKEQALIDGFVKLKSLKRCIKEGVIKNINNHYTFKFVKHDPFLTKAMLPSFGKVVNVRKGQFHTEDTPYKDSPWITDTIVLQDCFRYPVEVIEK
jgi:hypothetical protein